MGNPVDRLTNSSASQSSDDELSDNDSCLVESEPFLPVLPEALLSNPRIPVASMHYSDDDSISSEFGYSDLHQSAGAEFLIATPSSDDESETQHLHESEQEPGCVPDPLRQCPSFCQIFEELKKLLEIAGPMAALNCVVYVRAMVSVLFLGRLGGLQLAGGALSVGFTNITGYSVLAGLASGMDPVCGQAFGSGNYGMIGLALQRTILLLLLVSVPISALWYNLEAILLGLRQDPEITHVAAIYCRWSLLDLVANSFLQPLRIYLKSQGLATPMLWCSALAVLLHVPLNILLVFFLEKEVAGVALASVCTNLNMVLFILSYLWYSGALKGTWVPWSAKCLSDWCPLLSLALPSCVAVCLEWWWYEIMTVVAGYLPNPRVAVATTAIVIQTTSLMYTIPQALSSSVSTRVGNELGAGRPAKARVATLVALGCAFMIALVSLTWTTALRNTWGHVFTDDKNVLALTAAVMPLMGLCELGNCPQTTGVGVLRGSARPTIGAHINLGSFYFVGTPVAVALAFWFKVGFGGLWYGLLAAQIACAASILYVVLRTDWNYESERAQEFTKPLPDAELLPTTLAANPPKESFRIVPVNEDEDEDEDDGSRLEQGLRAPPQV